MGGAPPRKRGPLQTPLFSRAQSGSAGASGEGPGGSRTRGANVCACPCAEAHARPARVSGCWPGSVLGVFPPFSFGFSCFLGLQFLSSPPFPLFIYLFFLFFYSASPSPSVPLLLLRVCSSLCPACDPHYRVSAVTVHLPPAPVALPRCLSQALAQTCPWGHPSTCAPLCRLTQARLVLPAPRRHGTPRGGVQGAAGVEHPPDELSDLTLRAGSRGLSQTRPRGQEG